MQAIRQVYRYLKGTTELYITLGRIQDITFFAYADASYRDWPNTKSIEGAIWFFGGAPIRWYSRKQTIIAPSSTAVEWCALNRPARDAQWLMKIATVLNLPNAIKPIVILTDNINTQLLIGKRSCKNSTRWLDIRWFFVKDAIFREKINLLRVDTIHNVADGFTKALDKEAHDRFVHMLGL
jgi:hypothetical protein